MRQDFPVLGRNQQLLKWVGNKQRVAPLIIDQLPTSFGTYYEPFLGSGAVLASLAPQKGVGSDSYGPLIEIFQKLRTDPEGLVGWYTDRWVRAQDDKRATYDAVRASFNDRPNGPDFLFLSRACYGGVIRFRQKDGFMSTPCGCHRLMSPVAFADRVAEWHARVQKTKFLRADYRDVLSDAKPGDVVYCDPPYTRSQRILYGSQAFKLDSLLREIARLKDTGVRVILSIDGRRATDGNLVNLPIPDGLFEREMLVEGGRSMLKRFQMEGQTLEGAHVADRLLLTY